MPPRLVGMILICAFLAGCASDGGGPSVSPFDPELDERGPDAAWPFWPAEMRVHPLTRIVEDESGEGHLLEARIEFVDGNGYTSRAYGFLRLGLYDGEPSPGREITGWNIDLRNLDANDNHFDDVSRMYLLRLQFGEEPVPSVPVLVAEYYSLNGVDLNQTHRLGR